MNGNAGAPKSAAPTPSMSPPSIASISNILIGVIIGIDYLILLPIFIVCVRILYINQKIQVFRSRRPITLKYILFLTFIVFALVEPYRLLDGSIANISLIPYHISSWISSSIEYTFTLGLLLCYAQRSYLIHYDFNYHEAILNNEWKQFTSRHQIQLEWYLKHRNKFGNRTFTTFIIIIIWIILSAFLTALAYHFNIEAHWIIIVLILFAMVEIFQLKLILRMPGLDVFRIRDEYMYLLTIGLTLIIIIFCLLIFYDVNNINQIIISRLIYHLTVMIGTVFISTISIIYPYRVYHSIQKDLNNRDIIRTNSNNKNKKKNKKHSVQRLKKSSAISNSPINKSRSVIEMTGVNNRNNNNGYHVSLDELLKSFVGIESFLKHLVKELSAENLFFLSDIVQYKNSFINEGIFDEIIGWNMDLPLDDIPKSNILVVEKDFYCRSKLICNKYIRIDSEREINISYSTRLNIINSFDQLDMCTKPELNTLFQRFDIAADEIRKLLSDSFRRFCLTTEYKKFCRDYNAPVKRLHRKLSKSVRSFAREISRDRSMSKDISGDISNLSDRSPRLHSMKRLSSYPSRSINNNGKKLSDISEYKEENSNNRHTILPPMSLSNTNNNSITTYNNTMSLNKYHSNVLELPETNSPIINHNNNGTNIIKFSSYTINELSKSSDESFSNNNNKTATITKRKSSTKHKDTLPSKSDNINHLEVRIGLYDSSDDETPNNNNNKNTILSVLVPNIHNMQMQPAMTPPPPNYDSDFQNNMKQNIPKQHIQKNDMPIQIIEQNNNEDSKSLDSQFSTAM